MRDGVWLGTIVLGLLAAFLADVFVFPGYPLSGVYALPVLLAALRLSPRAVVGFAAAAAALNLTGNLLQALPPGMAAFELASVLVATGIAYALAAQRRETTRLAGEREAALRQEQSLRSEADAARERIARSELAVREQREWLQTTLSSIGDAVIATDTAGDITFLNPVAERLTGWPAADAVGQPIELVCRVLDERTRRPAELPVGRALREGSTVGFANHAVLIARDGRELPIDDSAAPIRGGGGEITGVVLVFRDVTASRQAAAELRAARDQLRAILEGIADGVTVQDANGRLVFANDAAARTIGFPTAAALLATPLPEIMGRFEVMDEVGRPLPLDELPGRRALAGEPEAERLVRYRIRATGEERWSQVRASPVFDADGRVALAINILHDVSAQRRAAAAQRFLAEASVVLQSSLDYETTLQAVADLAVPVLGDWCVINLVERDGVVRRVASAHTDPAKRDLVEAVRRYPPEIGSENRTARAIRTGRAEIAEVTPEVLRQTTRDAEHLRIVQALGIRRYLVTPLKVRDRVLGALMCVSGGDRRYGEEDLALAEELARRAALAIDNARLYQQAREALQARDLFISTVSHDLRNPLTSIRGTAQGLERRLARQGDPAGRELAERAGAIVRSTDRLDALIEELLDTTRIQSGQPLDLRRRETDLGVLLRRAVAEHTPIAEGHRITVEPDAALSIIGSFDPARLRRVLDNLLGNALKYSPNGGEIRVGLRREAGETPTDDWAVLTVRDEGLGIPAGDLPRVFERFYRASNVEGRIAGTGIGLAGVRQIVEQHGGTVTAESVAGRGSTFTVRLPLQPPTDSSGPE